MGGGSIPGSPDVMTPGTGTDPFLHAPHRLNPDRASVASDMSEDYFTQRRGSTINNGSPGTPQQEYGNFLDRANRQIARDKKHVPDPFLEPGMAAPTRPFGAHSRVSSVESISSIVDEKQNSPLNKAIASVSLISFLYSLLPLLNGVVLVHGYGRWCYFRFRWQTPGSQFQQLQARIVHREVPNQERGSLLRQGQEGQTFERRQRQVFTARFRLGNSFQLRLLTSIL